MSETKENDVPVSICCHFDTLEQKLIFEAVVLPDLTKVLIKYAPLLGYDNN